MLKFYAILMSTIKKLYFYLLDLNIYLLELNKACEGYYYIVFNDSY